MIAALVSFSMPSPLTLGIGLLLIVAGGTGLRSQALRERLVARLAELNGGASRRRRRNEGGAGPFGRLGGWLAQTALIGAPERERLRRMLALAGYSKPGHLATLVGAKLAGVLGGGALVLLGGGPLPAGFGAAGLGPGGIWAQALGVGLLGWRIPDLVLGVLRDRRRDQVAKALPDALDLLVICGEAGLGLEAAIDRVAYEIAEAYPALGAELAITAAEMRVLADRTAALNNLASRLDVDGVRGLATTLIQAMRYGTPLGQALRVLAAEMRAHRLAAFEERAARLPVMLTLPMVLFILPCVFIIIGGPAMLDISSHFTNNGGSP